MKHLPILLLSSIAMVASAGQPQHHPAKTPFTGFSVIAEAGGIVGKADLVQNMTSFREGPFPVVYTNSAHIPEGGATGALGLAYSHQFHSGLVLAGVFTAGFNYLTFEGEVNAAAGLPGANESFAQGQLKTELRNDFALLLKPGVAIGNTLVYGLIGPRWGNFESSLDNQLTVNSDSPLFQVSLSSHANQSAYHMGIAVGAGLSQRLWSHVVAGVEYQYTAYSNGIASFHPNNTSAPDTPIVGSKIGYTAYGSVDRINTNTLMATVAYQF